MNLNVAVQEAEHIDTSRDIEGFAARTVDSLAAQDASREVNDLQGGLAVVADDELAIAKEGEAVIIAVAASGKHQLETALIVGRASLEGVARGGEQVYVGAGQVVDEVQVVHFHAFRINREGVAAVFCGLEID